MPINPPIDPNALRFDQDTVPPGPPGQPFVPRIQDAIPVQAPQPSAQAAPAPYVPTIQNAIPVQAPQGPAQPIPLAPVSTDTKDRLGMTADEALPVESFPKGWLYGRQAWDEEKQQWYWEQLDRADAPDRRVGAATPRSIWQWGKGLIRNLFVPLMGSTQAQVDEDVRRILQVDPEREKEFFDEEGNITVKGADAWTSFKRGIDQLQQTAYGVGLLSADLMGADKFRRSMEEGVRRQQEEMRTVRPEVASLKDIGLGYESGPAEAGPRTRRLAVYGSQAFFENVPTMLMTLGVGGVAGLVAKKVIRKTISKKVVDEALSRIALQELEKAGARNVLRSQIGGTVAAASFQETGAIYVDMFENDIRGPGPAFMAMAAGLAAGTLEAITPLLLIRRVGNQPIKSPIEAMVRSTLGDQFMEKGVVRLGVGGFEGMMTEGVTEYLQTAIEIAARMSQDPKVQGRFWEAFFQGVEVREELKEGFAKGFFAGGGMGAGAAVIQTYVDRVQGGPQKRALELGAKHAIANANKPRMQPVELRKPDGSTLTIFVPVRPSVVPTSPLRGPSPALPGVEGPQQVTQAIGMGFPESAEALNRPGFFAGGRALPALDVTRGAEIAQEAPVPRTPTQRAAQQVAEGLPPVAPETPAPPAAQPAPADTTAQGPVEGAAGVAQSAQVLGLRGWLRKLFPDLRNYQVVETGQQYPQEVQDNLRAQGFEPNDLDAAYHNGQVYFNASKFPIGDPALVQEKVFHEAGTHLGLRTILGPERFSRLTQDVYRGLSDADRSDIAIRNNIPITREEPIGEEWLAYESERVLQEGVSNTVWSRIADGIRQALRRLRIPVKFSDTEIANLVNRGLEAARGRPERIYTRPDATQASVTPQYGPGHPLAEVNTIRYSVADVRRATLEGTREYTPEVVGADLENAFEAVKNILYIEAEMLSDFIPPRTPWHQPQEGQSLIEYLRRFYSPEGVALLRRTFARSQPPAFVTNKKTWHMVKSELNEVAKGMVSPNSGFGGSFLALNRKTGGVSWDFGLGTCMPSENCSVCYAKGMSDPTTGSRARVRHSIVTALEPEAVGSLVARYIRNRPKGDQAFLRVNGSGDTTFPWQAAAVNRAISELDRPVHIFSRSHVSRAPGTIGLDSISTGQYDPNDIENGVTVYKMGSIDRQLVDHYGEKFLRENLEKRGIINSYLVKDVKDIPYIQRLRDAGVFMVLHINKTNALTQALAEAGIIANKENPELNVPSCYCALESGPFYNGCATCLVGGGPCFAMGTTIGMTPDGQLALLNKILLGEADPPAERMVEMSRVGVPRDRTQVLADAAARSYAMAASNLQGSIRQWERGDVKRVKVENPRSREVLYYAGNKAEVAQAQQVVKDWQAYAKRLNGLVQLWKDSTGFNRIMLEGEMKEALTLDQAITEGVATAQRAVAESETRFSVSRQDQPEPLDATVQFEGPPPNTGGDAVVYPPNPTLVVPEHDSDYLMYYSISRAPTGPEPIANADMERSMQELGLNYTVNEALGKSDAELMANVQRRVAREPSWVMSIFKREQKKPGFLTDEETMALDVWGLQLRHKVHENSKVADILTLEGRLDEAVPYRNEAERYGSALMQLAEVTRKSGTIAARAFRARQLAARWDYTVDSMFYERRRAQKWEFQTKEERDALWAEMERQAREYKELTEALEEENRRLKGRDVDAEIRKALQEVSEINPEVMQFAKEWVRKYVRRADNAVDRLKVKWARAFPDTPLRASVTGGAAQLPSDILNDLAIVGGSKIAANITDRQAWQAAMVEELGQNITPYFEQIWEASQVHFNQELTNARAEMEARRPPRGPREAPGGIEQEIAAAKTKIHQVVTNQQNSTEPAAPIEDEIYYPVQSLIRKLIEQDPLMTREDLIDQVHAVLQEDMPQWTESETMDAISGRGRWRRPSQETIAKKIRDLKAQIRILSNIADTRAEQPLPRTGFQPDPLTGEQRRLLKELSDAKRLHGEVVTNRESNLKTYLDSRKTFYRNRIADLQWEIDNNRRIARNQRTKETDEELEALKREYRRTREEHDSIFMTPEITVEEQIRRSEKAAERMILKLESDLAAGRRTYARKKDPLVSTKLEALRLRIVQLKAEQEFAQMEIEPPPDLAKPEDYRRWFQLDREIRKLENQLVKQDVFPKSKPIRPEDTPTNKRMAAKLEELREQRKEMRKKLGPGPPDPVQKAIKLRLSQLRRQIADYQKRLAERDFEPRRRREPLAAVSTNPEVVKMLAKRDRIVTDYQAEVAKDRWRKATTMKKVWHGIQRTRAAVTNLRSSFDFSALRQGLPAMMSLAFRIPGSPINIPPRIAKVFWQMFRAALSREKADEYNANIRLKPNWESGAYKMMNLQFTDLDSPTFTKAEENAKSVFDEWAKLDFKTGNLAKTLVTAPFKALSKPIAGSNRAFATFLNLTRSELADVILDANFRDRPPTEAELQVLGNWVNVATGRGTFLPASWNEPMAFFLWAPKLMVSRIQFILGEPLYGGGVSLKQGGRARAIVAKEYARVIITGFMLYMIARMFSEKNEEDLTSSEAGKIVRGNTRIDIWGGVQQPLVMAARQILGRQKSISGRQVNVGWDRPYGAPSRIDLFLRFGRSKLRPDVGVLWNLIEGRDFVGREVTPGRVAEELFVPLPFADLKKTIEDRGFTEAMVLQMLNQFGAGINVYEPTRRETLQWTPEYTRRRE